jgi:hypothetical protein
VFLAHLKRNAHASVAMRQWLKFSSKVAFRCDATRADVVAIHQHVLKSTTSAGAVRDVKTRLVDLVCLVCLVYLVEQD